MLLALRCENSAQLHKLKSLRFRVSGGLHNIEALIIIV